MVGQKCQPHPDVHVHLLSGVCQGRIWQVAKGGDHRVAGIASQAPPGGGHLYFVVEVLLHQDQVLIPSVHQKYQIGCYCCFLGKYYLVLNIL